MVKEMHPLIKVGSANVFHAYFNTMQNMQLHLLFMPFKIRILTIEIALPSAAGVAMDAGTVSPSRNLSIAKHPTFGDSAVTLPKRHSQAVKRKKLKRGPCLEN